MKPEISKTARDLLAKQPSADLHPSPDLLNGYVEQSLNPAENTQVLTHLTSCADCREVVFLASSAAEEVVLPLIAAAPKAAEVRPLAAANPASDARQRRGVLKPSPKRKNVWWKWAAPVAAVMIIGVTALVERDEIAGRLNPPGTEVANVQRPAPATSPVVQADKAEQPSQSNAVVLNAPPAKSENKISATYAAKKGEAAPRGKSVVGEEAAPRKFQSKELASDLVSPHADLRAGTAQAKTAQSVAAGLQSDEASSAPNGGNDITYVAPDAIQPQSLAKSSLVANDQAVTGTAATVSMSRHQIANPHWRIGEAGQLERSTDTGTWTQKLASEEVTFRAVATVGSDVWAGGNGGALFHSSDDGEHFNKVVLSANGQTERGTITSIRFDTAQQGSVTTDSGATWTTTDGGQSWSRQ